MSALVLLSQSRRLAASAQPIAEALIDLLRRSKVAPRRPAGQIDERGQGELRLDDGQEDDVSATPDDDVLLPVDDAAGAVLLGRALDQDRDALARLQDRDAFTVIEVADPDLVRPIASILRLYVFGKERTVTGEGHGSKDVRVLPAGTVALFDDHGDTKKKDVTPDVVAAVESRCAVVVVSAAPGRYLTPELLRLVNIRIAVPRFDANAVADVIASIAGRHPASIDESLAKEVTLNALRLAVRADLGPAASLARLARLLGDTERDISKGPTLSELHGLGRAKEWGLSLAADLREYRSGALPWHAVSGHAILLSGPPGTGKTSYARALARECGVAFVSTSYADWQAYREGHLGNVVTAIRKVFTEARAKAPCILFIDEIDALPARRSGDKHDSWFTAVVDCLLIEMDGAERREGVIIIAAANHPAALDPALVRSGRLDRHIEISLPDVPGLVGIFRSHLGQGLAGADLLPAALSARGHTGADVERWVREARGKARRAGQPLTINLLVDTVRGSTPALPEQVCRLVSYHEAAHALANISLRLAKPVSLSIGASGDGETNSVIDEIRAQTRHDIEQCLVSLLAGRAAEEIACGITTAGAGGSAASDLGHATRIAVRLETVYGLGASGLAHIPCEPDRLLLMRPDLLAAVQASLDRAYARAKDLLNANCPSLDALATALFERSYLDAVEIEAVLQATPLARAAVAGEQVAITPPSTDGPPERPQDAIGPEFDADVTGVEPATS
jgi:cell division protease FtsH